MSFKPNVLLMDLVIYKTYQTLSKRPGLYGYLFSRYWIQLFLAISGSFFLRNRVSEILSRNTYFCKNRLKITPVWPIVLEIWYFSHFGWFFLTLFSMATISTVRRFYMGLFFNVIRLTFSGKILDPKFWL